MIFVIQNNNNNNNQMNVKNNRMKKMIIYQFMYYNSCFLKDGEFLFALRIKGFQLSETFLSPGAT